MDQETNPTQVLCSNGCGFYGNLRNNGMCSVCYRDSLQRQNSSGRSCDPGSSSVSGIGDAVTVQLTSQSERSSPRLSTPEASASSSPARQDGPSASASASASSASGSDAPVDLTFSRLSKSVQEASTDQQRSSEESSIRGKRKLEDSPQHTGGESPEAHGSAQSPDSPAPSSPRKNRCFLCRKKVGLTGFDCRCGQMFCSVHRYSDMHSCSFDYKADGAEKLRKENPRVVGEKIKKI